MIKILNTNGGRGILASTPHIVLCNTMWGVDAKNPLPPLALHNTIGDRGISSCTTYMAGPPDHMRTQGLVLTKS